ncbi:hypothetical protein [Brevibacillus brevis]|uniref:hypothetical protein n=1 Tax=Brevibacillus brevis TaxID=1393 RepID=UPI003D1A7DC8
MGVDEEQLSMIVSALEETARRYDQQGMIMVALKMRITAEKVTEIKKSSGVRASSKNPWSLGEKRKATCYEQMG